MTVVVLAPFWRWVLRFFWRRNPRVSGVAIRPWDDRSPISHARYRHGVPHRPPELAGIV